METGVLKTNIKKLIDQRNIFVAFAALMSLSTLCLSLLLFTKRERVVVVPTTGPSFWIEKGRVSDEYLEEMGTFLSQMLLSRTPADVDWRNQTVLKHIDPSFYHTAKKILDQDKANIVSQNQTLLFRPAVSYVDSAHSTYVIEGTRHIFVPKPTHASDEASGHPMAHTQVARKRYTFGFRCQGGRLLLTSLKQESI